MTDGQAYSLLAALAASGSVHEILISVKSIFPEEYGAANKFLHLYDKYHDAKNYRHGNTYIDVAAFKKALFMTKFADRKEIEQALGHSLDV
jgi:hypothetical protein